MKVPGSELQPYEALGAMNDPSLKDFYKQTFKTDNSYAVQAEALIAIGKCGTKSDISFLKRCRDKAIIPRCGERCCTKSNCLNIRGSIEIK